jgi:hypothetical protein
MLGVNSMRKDCHSLHFAHCTAPATFNPTLADDIQIPEIDLTNDYTDGQVLKLMF